MNKTFRTYIYFIQKISSVKNHKDDTCFFKNAPILKLPFKNSKENLNDNFLSFIRYFRIRTETKMDALNLFLRKERFSYYIFLLLSMF